MIYGQSQEVMMMTDLTPDDLEDVSFIRNELAKFISQKLTEVEPDILIITMMSESVMSAFFYYKDEEFVKDFLEHAFEESKKYWLKAYGID